MARVSLVMNKLFSRATVDELERISNLPSGHPDKLRLTKEVIEPAKVKQLNHFDPYFKDVGTWIVNAPEFPNWAEDDDFILTMKSNYQQYIEFKRQLWSFSDRFNKDFADVRDYCCLSDKQCQRYSKLPNKIILYERLISNFDIRTPIGYKNYDAFVNFSNYPPTQTWEYLLIHTDEIKKWRKGIDYKLGYIKSNGEWLRIFNKNKVGKKIDLTKQLEFCSRKGIIASVYFKHEGTDSEDLGFGNWASVACA